MKITQNIKKHFALLLQGSAIVILARLAGAAIGLLTQIILARSIASEQLGLVFVALAIANIGSVVAALGYPSVSVRFIRRYHVKGFQILSKHFRKQSIKEVVLFSALLMMVLALIISLNLPAIKEGNALYWGIFMIPVFALLALNGGLANAYKRVDISYVPDVFIRPFLWLVFISISLVTGLSLKAEGVVISAFIATLIALFIQCIWMNLSLEKPIAPQPKQSTLKPRLNKLWRLAALPMIAMTLLTNMIFDIDVMVLSFLISNSEIAQFGIAFKIAFLIGFGVHIIQQAVYPKIADAFTLKNLSLMRMEILNSVVPATVGALFSMIIVIIFGQWILSLFGAEFEAAYTALLLLTFCLLIRAIAGPVSQILVLAGKQKQMLIGYGSGLILLVGLNVILVPLFGVDGAALALVGSTVYWSAYLSIAAFKATNVRVDGFAKDVLKYKLLQNVPFLKSGVRF